MIRISVEVPVEQGEVIAQALERAVERGDSCVGLEFTTLRDPSVEGVRDAADGAHGSSERTYGSGSGADGSAGPATANSWRAQQADALVAMAKAYLSGGNSGDKPCSAADHHQVVIHTDASALRGGISVDNSRAHGGLARSDLPIDTVRRLTCDGSLITIVEDDDGTPLDVGRKRRTVTTALRRALWSRDRHCTFPGCHNRCYVDAHHIEHWAEGGATSLENLMLLCTFHHTLLHEGGFKIRRDGDGAIYFQRPDGRVIPRFGYRLDDIQDDYAVAENPSMEVYEQQMNESAVVREPAAVYDLRSSRRNVFKCRSAPRVSPFASSSRDKLKCASA